MSLAIRSHTFGPRTTDEKRAAAPIVTPAKAGGGSQSPPPRIRMETGSRPTSTGSSAELLCELAQEVLAVEVATGAADLALEDGRVGEMLEEGHDVGKGLVEGMHVRVGRLAKARMNAVEKGVGRLVGDDVVGKAGEHDRPGSAALVLRGDREITKQERLLGRRVLGVALTERVGVDAQPAHELIGVGPVVFGHPAVRPQRFAAQCPFEMLNRRHRDGVDHLLVELRIRF